MVNSTVLSGTRGTLRLGLVGGEHIYFVLSISSMSHHCRSGRICPGIHLVHSIVTLTAASVLSTFDLTKKVDENGWEIEPKMEYTSFAIR
jgi:hypothetical protein